MSGSCADRLTRRVLILVVGVFWVQVASAASDDALAWSEFDAATAPIDAQASGAQAQTYPTGTVVWEGWPNARQTFLPRGRDPGTAVPTGNVPADMRFQTGFQAASVPARRVVAGHFQSFNPLLDADHLNETRLNRLAFTFIRAQELYSVEGQLAALKSGSEPDFPVGSVFLKAQWRPIADRDASRYRTMSLDLPPKGRRLYGLTAINLSIKRHAGSDGWLFAAFEHVDFCLAAMRCDRAKGALVDARAELRNYRLRGTMATPVDGAGQPVLLSNSQLEAGVQGSASCFTCHARASIGLLNGRAARLPVLNLNARPMAGDAVRGYIGAPQRSWYFDPGQSNGSRRYLPLDSVWSLALAQSEEKQ